MTTDTGASTIVELQEQAEPVCKHCTPDSGTALAQRRHVAQVALTVIAVVILAFSFLLVAVGFWGIGPSPATQSFRVAGSVLSIICCIAMYRIRRESGEVFCFLDPDSGKYHHFVGPRPKSEWYKFRYEHSLGPNSRMMRMSWNGTFRPTLYKWDMVKRNEWALWRPASFKGRRAGYTRVYPMRREALGFFLLPPEEVLAAHWSGLFPREVLRKAVEVSRRDDELGLWRSHFLNVVRWVECEYERARQARSGGRTVSPKVTQLNNLIKGQIEVSARGGRYGELGDLVAVYARLGGTADELKRLSELPSIPSEASVLADAPAENVSAS
ncbi:MAG: hypothetical protein AAB590_01435 [Patescibacteria group bacterium]